MDKNIMFHKILFVDANVNMRKTLTSFLSKRCDKLLMANNINDGLSLFSKESPSIVIASIKAKKMDTLGFAKKIFSINSNATFILLLEKKDTKTLYKAIELGIKEYIFSPISYEKFSKKLLLLWEKKEKKREKKSKRKLLNEYKKATDKNTIFIKMDTKGRFTYVNDTFSDFLSYSKKRLIGKSFVDFDLYLPILNQIIKTTSRGDTWQGLIDITSLDNIHITMDGYFYPITSKNGKFVGITGFLHDITELTAFRKIIQTKLDKSIHDVKEKQHYIDEYNKIFEEAIAMCRLSPYDGKILKSSIAFNKMFNITKQRANQVLFTSLVNWRKKQIKELRKSLQEHNIFRDSIKIPIKNSLYTFKITSTGIYSSLGELEEIVIVFEDVSSILNQQRNLYDMQIEFLYMLAQIIEKHSEETGFHTKRVAEYSALLASALGMNKEEIEQIRVSSIMHDLGKLGIPHNILTKNDTLNSDERIVMQRHSKIGYGILDQSEQPLLKTAATIAHEHHERWDGNGYPQGLKGKEISIYGRIVAIADVFDALSNQRAYKKAWDIEDVYEYLRVNKGVQFDPDLIDIFLSCKNMVETIRKNY